MLDAFSRIGMFDLEIDAKGDLAVDGHHTVEDVGIALGRSIKEALGDRRGIQRFASQMIPLDEALVMFVIDVGGRPYFVYDCDLPYGKVGDFETELVEEFFKSVTFNAELNIHIKLMYGKNIHHIVEAMFKAFGKVLNEATRINASIEGILSTKGGINIDCNS
jgi:imidazoleglycerol-phosphate dehydratase